MHIVFLSNEYPLWTSGGGLGSFLQTFGQALVEKKHRVTILGIGDSSSSERLEDEGIQLIRLPKNQGFLPNFIYNSRALNNALKKLHKEKPIDIIETPEMGLALISKRHNAKKVVRLHGGHHFFSEAEKRAINKRKGLLEKRSFRKADGFIAISKYVQLHTEKYLSYRGMPVALINNMIETEVTVPSVQIHSNRILFAGTVCEKKGIRQLIEALKIVREHYPKMQLDVFGRDWYFPDGSSYIELLKTTYDQSFLEHVHFHGHIPRETLYTKYAEATCCVFPSHMETQGLVTLEAMRLGKAVIFSKYGPGPETIAHGETGLLCDVYNPKDIAEKVMWILQHPEEANTMGNRAAAYVRENYNKNTILDKNLSFYNSLTTHG